MSHIVAIMRAFSWCVSLKCVFGFPHLFENDECIEVDARHFVMDFHSPPALVTKSPKINFKLFHCIGRERECNEQRIQTRILWREPTFDNALNCFFYRFVFDCTDRVWLRCAWAEIESTWQLCIGSADVGTHCVVAEAEWVVITFGSHIRPLDVCMRRCISNIRYRWSIRVQLVDPHKGKMMDIENPLTATNDGTNSTTACRTCLLFINQAMKWVLKDNR